MISAHTLTLETEAAGVKADLPDRRPVGRGDQP
jgi:hypothetical protein